ncbi:MAG: DsrE family protein [Deltaproteobacteria bacterium]|nr:DsrE family protein [Deltaproteobacteria bacterium]
MMDIRKLSLFVMLFVISITLYFIPKQVFAKKNNPVNGYSYQYFKHHSLKAVWQAPYNPKKYGLFTLQLTHNLMSALGHNVHVKEVVVAPGPAIHYLMKKYDAANYSKIKRLSELGVKFLACHAALVAFHVKKNELFPFAGVAYPSGIFYIIKKEEQGYAYFNIGW